MPVVRSGKTQKDRNSGALGRNVANKAARAQWNRDNSSRVGNPTAFPADTCNGKKQPTRLRTVRGGKQARV